MGAYANMEKGVAGLKYGLDAQVETLRATEEINFGDPLFGYVGNDRDAFKMHTDRGIVVLDADLITANVATWTINGYTGAVTFGSTHALTMAALIASIEAGVPNSNASLNPADTDSRTLWVDVDGVNMSVALVITLGVTQANVAVTYSNRQVFMGVALFVQKEGGKYNANDAVNCLTEGKIYVTANVAVDANSAAYVLIPSGASQGKFTGSSSGNKATGGIFRETLSGTGLVLLELGSAIV